MPKLNNLVFSQQIRHSDGRTGLFLEYQDNEDGHQKSVLWVPYGTITQNKTPLGVAELVPTSKVYSYSKAGQKPLQDDKFHRSWVHKMHDKWKNNQLIRL